MSYSRTTFRRTTIGAAAFHCRVRNGNGWCHCATITRGPSRTGVSLQPQRRKRESASLMTMSIVQFQKNRWFSGIYIQEAKANVKASF